MLKKQIVYRLYFVFRKIFHSILKTNSFEQQIAFFINVDDDLLDIYVCYVVRRSASINVKELLKWVDQLYYFIHFLNFSSTQKAVAHYS